MKTIAATIAIVMVVLLIVYFFMFKPLIRLYEERLNRIHCRLGEISNELDYVYKQEGLDYGQEHEAHMKESKKSESPSV